MSSLSTVRCICLVALPKVWRFLLIYLFLRANLTSFRKEIINQESLSIPTSVGYFSCHSFLRLHTTGTLWHDHVEQRLHIIVLVDFTSRFMNTFWDPLLRLLCGWGTGAEYLIVVGHEDICLCEVKWHMLLRWGLLFAVCRWRTENLLLLRSGVSRCSIFERV